MSGLIGEMKLGVFAGLMPDLYTELYNDRALDELMPFACSEQVCVFRPINVPKEIEVESRGFQWLHVSVYLKPAWVDLKHYVEPALVRIFTREPQTPRIATNLTWHDAATVNATLFEQ